MSAQAASHGLQYHARAIASQTGNTAGSCWLAGTTAAAEENEVCTVAARLAPLLCKCKFSCMPDILPGPDTVSIPVASMDTLDDCIPNAPKLIFDIHRSIGLKPCYLVVSSLLDMAKQEERCTGSLQAWLLLCRFSYCSLMLRRIA